MAASRIVIALDCDCFYAQCEVLRTPALRGKPVGVRQKMLVITSSYEARAFGIKKGDSLAEVRRKCPEITICDGEDLTFYTETSNRWRAFVEAHCQGCAVERLGLDELFVDATAIVDKRLREGAAAPRTSPACHAAGEAGPEPARFAAAAAFCEDLRARTRDALGLETSGGVSSNKLLAKLATRPRPFDVARPGENDRRSVRGTSPSSRRRSRRRPTTCGSRCRTTWTSGKSRASASAPPRRSRRSASAPSASSGICGPATASWTTRPSRGSGASRAASTTTP
jgi:DNA polymerase iota